MSLSFVVRKANTQHFYVGASLLAIAVDQSTAMLNVMPPSRAGSLPQLFCVPAMPVGAAEGCDPGVIVSTVVQSCNKATKVFSRKIIKPNKNNRLSKF
ncbi:hypothetical protein [Pseudomonas sp. PDM27]|uniref:hypothetical protein n=1 Tax=Pseudomonas sp. PDM27 TaxID=2854769 RepID=UPI001C47E02F|nr:hypothetical protein [Pseudomonas sp. PDM27]MBV7569273.1 hypothetical protein [Pseudomonas sp. PDM27]